MAPGMGPVEGGGGQTARGTGDARGMLMLAQGSQALQVPRVCANQLQLSPTQGPLLPPALLLRQSTKGLRLSTGRASPATGHIPPPPPLHWGKLREVWREAWLPRTHTWEADLWEIPSWPMTASAALSCLL